MGLNVYRENATDSTHLIDEIALNTYKGKGDFVRQTDGMTLNAYGSERL